MWPWTKRRERFSLEELRYLTEQLQRTSLVNDFNKEAIVETLRSIAELMIWGDQHDPLFFEHFMEKQVMVLFLNVLNISKAVTVVAVQLLQSLSIMIQNLQHEHAIYYIFSNGYLNHFITYPFDFHNEELLAYYISFLRTISTKLDRTTISFFIKTDGDEVVFFPLYTEAIKFFRHEESMVRIAVRALTLNVYQVEDETIRKFITSKTVVGYIEDLVQFLNDKSSEVVAHTRFEDGIAETEEILDYCNDIICAGIPELSHVMTDNLLQLYVFPLFCLFDSDKVLPALHSLARVLNIVRHKPVANGIAAAIICESTLVDRRTGQTFSIRVGKANSNCTKPPPNGLSAPCPRKAILSCIASGNEELAFMSVFFLLALLHSEVDDSLLDFIGLLPRLKQHKRRLLQTLMDTNPDEELLFSSFSDKNGSKNAVLESQGVFMVETLPVEKCTESDNAKECCDVSDSSLRAQEIVEKLVEMLCIRPAPSFPALCYAGALLWQIFPEKEDNTRRLEKMQNAYLQAKDDLLKEVEDCWCDHIPSVISVEWKRCKKALESLHVEKEGPSFPRMPGPGIQSEDDLSSSAVAERMLNTVKVFAILHQVQQLLRQGSIKEHALLDTSPTSISNVKIGKETDLSGGIPCRIAFERGKEHEVYLKPVTNGNLGWLVLVESVNGRGLIRGMAPLSGCLPEIDEERPRWLHLRIRPPSLPFSDTKKLGPASKVRRVDGRWTLSFLNEETCQQAKKAVEEQLLVQKNAVLEQLRPLLNGD